MRFDDLSQLPILAKRTGFTIFELPQPIDFATILPQAYRITPNDKNHILKEDIDTLIDLTKTKQATDFFCVVEYAETLNPNSAAAALKLLEEPKSNVHLVFLVRHSNQLIPTILSRAQLYTYTATDPASIPPSGDSILVDLAKQYLSATPRDLPSIVTTLTKTKLPKKTSATQTLQSASDDNARQVALAVVDLTITIATQSYLKTGDQRFISKLTKLLKTYDALSKNGNVKLQLIANML
ncbi:hypothetical protein IKF15_04295 [Candidatus Saccharibacteria bacterium]|nr:hypothetical protein [Candidatus Saccharibacteria bacterium]